MTERTCKLCGKPIGGAETIEFQIGGQFVQIGATVHDYCSDRFIDEESKRKPYRQPLDDSSSSMRNRVGNLIQELKETIRDFD